MAHKDRKPDVQKRFEEEENAGRFAGGDADAQQAKQDALRQGAEDTTAYTFNAPPTENRPGAGNPNDAFTDAAAHRGSANFEDFTGDAQNVNDEGGRPLSNDELERARNKANSSKGNDDSSSL